MRKLFLLIVLYSFYANAQIDYVSVGYGSMKLDSYKGGGGYLSVGVESNIGKSEGHFGGTLFLGGDSRIQYGGEDNGLGFVGLAVFQDIEVGNNFRFGIFAGPSWVQTYERVDDTTNSIINQQSGLRSSPRHTGSEFQPFAGIKLGWKLLEVQYAPIPKAVTATLGFKLYRYKK